ncbi:unnamed protein product [Didymodactylos carnosus]|uniref:Uncharacterized protein n=1 Tax=Didymodactylos carnosus TaxID=1234261 RepID=A0A8S2CVR1_9BILA|nr:unnamed protein product [Didymodactylos carnosus]CAF3599699.1 unnamed protein product [Didymodactylos carnosus]
MEQFRPLIIALLIVAVSCTFVLGYPMVRDNEPDRFERTNQFLRTLLDALRTDRRDDGGYLGDGCGPVAC